MEQLADIEMQDNEAHSFQYNNINNHGIQFGYPQQNFDTLHEESSTLLNMRCYKMALQSCEKVLQCQPLNEQCIINKVRSMWGLRLYKEAIEYLNTLNYSGLLSLPHFQELIKTAEKLLHQSNGHYDMVEIMDLPPNKCLQVAEYTGPIQLGHINGKGRGFIATQFIEPGQLLICSRAFALVFGKDMGLSLDERATDRGALVNDIFQKLSCESDLRQEFWVILLKMKPDAINRRIFIFNNKFYILAGTERSYNKKGQRQRQ
jgi:hypothetical protein